MNARLLFLAWTGVYCMTITKTDARSSQGVKSYVVNLDQEPRQRWNDVLKDFDPQLIVDGVNYALGLMDVDGMLKKVAVKVAGDLDHFIPQPYADEMRGISDFWNIDLGYIVLENLLYDLAAHAGSPIGSRACTSIVTMDQDNRILHGRNLDYDLPNVLAKLVTQIQFQRNGKTVFYSVTYAGQVGAATGFKPGMFSLTLNQRDVGKLWKNLLSGLEGAMPTFFYFRETLEKAESYDDAVQILGKMRTIAPVYLIVGGIKPYEASVAIGDRWGATIERMNDTLQHGWYVVETNYDPWKKPPADDDRRDVAIKLMENLGQKNINQTTLYKVLSTAPILNEQTVYTTLMSAADESIFHTVVRVPPDL